MSQGKIEKVHKWSEKNEISLVQDWNEQITRKGFLDLTRKTRIRNIFRRKIGHFFCTFLVIFT